MSIVKPVRPEVRVVGVFTSPRISNGEAWAAEMDANTRSLNRLTWLMERLPKISRRLDEWLIDRSARLVADGDRIEDVGRKHLDDPFWWSAHYDGSEF